MIYYFALFFQVVVSSFFGTLEIYDQNFENSFLPIDDPIIIIKLLPNGFVATGSFDEVKVWNPIDINNWDLIQTYTGHSGQIYSIDYIDKDTLVSGASFVEESLVSDFFIHVWSISTGVAKIKFRTENFCYGWSVQSLKMLSDGIHLASGLEDGQIKIWNINDGSLVSILDGDWVGQAIGEFRNYASDIILINDETLAACFIDGFIRIFDLSSNTLKFNLTDHGSYVISLKMITSEIIASGSVDTTVKLWNTTDGSLIRTLANHTASVYFGVDLFNDQILVSASFDTTLKFWDWNTGELLNTIEADVPITGMVILNQTTSSRNFLFSKILFIN